MTHPTDHPWNVLPPEARLNGVLERANLRSRLSVAAGQPLTTPDALSACAGALDSLLTVLESTDLAPLSAKARNREAVRILERLGARIRDLTDEERANLRRLLARDAQDAHLRTHP